MRPIPVFAVLCFLVACSGATTSGPDGASGGSETCGPNGFPRLDGTPEGCEVVVGACCYHASADACAAAHCPLGACLVLESYPGQIQCNEGAALPGD